MSKLAETYLHLDINLDETEKSKLKNYLLSKAPIYSEGFFNQELEFAIYVEDGSVKIWLAAAGALYAGIASYGSFRTGIDYLVKDAQAISERLFEDVKQSGISYQQVTNFQRRLGVPGQIKRVLQKIKRLEKNGQSLSKENYKIHMQSISGALERISKNLDHQQDLQLLRENIPQQLRASIPKRLPSREIELAQYIALRPEEFETNITYPTSIPTLLIDSNKHSNIWLDSNYEVKEIPNGIQLLPRKI